MAWTVEFLRSAADDFEALLPEIQRRVADEIDRIATNPFGPGTKRLAGFPELMRSRVADVRILYQAKNTTVTIARIGSRGSVYRRLDRVVKRLP